MRQGRSSGFRRRSAPTGLAARKWHSSCQSSPRRIDYAPSPSPLTRPPGESFEQPVAQHQKVIDRGTYVQHHEGEQYTGSDAVRDARTKSLKIRQRTRRAAEAARLHPTARHADPACHMTTGRMTSSTCATWAMVPLIPTVRSRIGLDISQPWIGAMLSRTKGTGPSQPLTGAMNGAGDRAITRSLGVRPPRSRPCAPA